jgi:hypothetical protein
LFGFEVIQIKTPAQKNAGVLILVYGILDASNSLTNLYFSAATFIAVSSTQVLTTDESSFQKICQENCQEKVKWV